MVENNLSGEKKGQKPEKTKQSFSALAMSMQNSFMKTPLAKTPLPSTKPGQGKDIAFIERSTTGHKEQEKTSSTSKEQEKKGSTSKVQVDVSEAKKQVPVSSRSIPTPIKPPLAMTLQIQQKTMSDIPNLQFPKDLGNYDTVQDVATSKKSTKIEGNYNAEQETTASQETIDMDYEEPHKNSKYQNMPETIQMDSGEASKKDIGMANTITDGLDEANEADENSFTKQDPLNLLNKVLLRKYHVVDFLGQGGMGAVYLAEHKLLESKRALKFLPKSQDMKKEMLKRFIHEAKAASNVVHPNIVQVYDLEDVDKYYFIVMEYVKGEGLDDFLKREGALYSSGDLKQIIIPVASGLSAIHNAKMVHRDIKPANIMISESGDIKITDFGIVKELDARTALTSPSAILGTPQFMSPEQVTSSNVDFRSDIYSLGATLYYMVTGQPCFQGTLMQLMYSVINTEPIPPQEINPKLDMKVSKIILKMLAKSPNDRYQSMQEVMEAVKKL